MIRIQIRDEAKLFKIGVVDFHAILCIILVKVGDLLEIEKIVRIFLDTRRNMIHD